MRLKVKWIKGWAYIHGTGPDGGRVRKSLKTRDPRRAEEKRAQIEAKLWRVGLYGAGEVVTFDECAVAYAEDGGDPRFLVRISQELSGLRLKDITPRDIRSAARKAYPNASNATINRQGITPAKAVINYGHAQGWCGLIKVESLPVKKAKRKAVDREYIDALKPHLPDRTFALMLFLFQTGRRVGDAIYMKPDWLDLETMRVFIPETKNGEPATVVITSEVAELISGLSPRHGRVFGYVHRSSLYNTLRRACKNAGVEYLGTHQPGRHSFATSLSDAGWGSKAIAEAGGWKSTRLVAETYEHPVDAQQKAARHFGRKLAKSKILGSKN
ncbi:MAG: tyrosine-type recombinase/integrase [Pikeienuella sp.]